MMRKGVLLREPETVMRASVRCIPVGVWVKLRLW